MTDFSALIQQGAGNVWVFIPSAILLGVLHGLEPGHSKTMMAAFIIAVHGTIRQAILLGLSATLSHTSVVWLVALSGLYFGAHWSTESTEPCFQVASAILMIGIAVWMMFRTWRYSHHHTHDHEHHHDESKIIDTGHGVLRLEIFEDGVPPCFRIHSESPGTLNENLNTVYLLEAERTNGKREVFLFERKGAFFESIKPIPEPHEFVARLQINDGAHQHDFDVEFTEHGHSHALPELEELEVAAAGYQDPHELAHANDIRRRFVNKHVTTPQIIIFGLTGGLIPCPAAITVLLLCLQLKKVTMGAALVLCFSLGLALTMVASGVLAALSVKHVSKQWSGFGSIAKRAPYFSGALITLVGLYILYHGLIALI
jgi:nickel/cobalt exporter